MTTYAKIKVEAIHFGNAISPAEQPNNALFIDSSSNELSNKDSSGSTAPLAATASPFNKQMQSGIVGTIAANTPVAKLSANGKIAPAGSDTVNAQEYVGITLEDFVGYDSLGLVHCTGPNIAGVLPSGFVPGDEVFLNEGGGYISDPALFTGSNDSIIRLGIADCAAGAASAIATDLILFPEVIARP
jgi:hypothetical protein